MIHIRNGLTPTYGSDNSFYKFDVWVHREILLVGRWTEVANNGDSAWASNYSETITDLYVNAAYPDRIYRATGSFVSTPASSALSLYDAVNDENRVIVNILYAGLDFIVIDTRNLAKPLVEATGLTGKVHKWGQTSLLTAGAWTVLAAPGTEPDRFQVRFEVGTTANRPWIYGYPKGDYATAKTITAGLTWAFGTTERRALFNADIDGEQFQIWFWPGYSSAGLATESTVLLWAAGRLTDTAVGDDYPLFITGNVNPSTYGGVYPSWDWCQSWPLMMVGKFGEQVTGYAEHLKYMSDASYTTSLFHLDRWFTSLGRTARQYPWVVMTDVAGGGFRRGRLPWRAIHETWIDWMPIDDLGEQRVAQGKMIVPRAGSLSADLVKPVLYFP